MLPPTPTLPTLLSTLLPKTHLTRPPQHPTHPSLTAKISSLLLHPTLEATLHILNADLPSAHFLVRHMQAPPAIEGMLLHAILHRCEGDVQNARAWAGDVRDAGEGWVPKRRGGERLEGRVVGEMEGRVGGGLVKFVYGGSGAEMESIIDDVERWRRDGRKEEEMELEERIRKELERVLEWCRAKFGDGEWVDASSAWVRHGEEVRKKGEDMVSGGNGWRDY